MCPFWKGWINPTSSYGHVGPMGCFDHQSARRLAAISGRVSWSTGCERFARQRAHPTSVEGVLASWNPQQKSMQKKGENWVFCRLRCLGGSRLNLRTYELPPTGKKPSNLESEDNFFLKSYNHTCNLQSIFIFMLISRFWRLYHPHWTKVKFFCPKTLWKIYGTLGEFWAALL